MIPCVPALGFAFQRRPWFLRLLDAIDFRGSSLGVATEGWPEGVRMGVFRTLTPD